MAVKATTVAVGFWELIQDFSEADIESILQNIRVFYSFYDRIEELKSFLFHPKTTQAEKEKMITLCVYVETGKDLLTRLLLLCIERAEKIAFVTMIKELKKQRDAKFHVLSVQVTTAEKLSGSAKKMLEDRLKQSFQVERVEMHEHVSNEIFSGIVLQMNDRIVDVSTARKLHIIQEKLST